MLPRTKFQRRILLLIALVLGLCAVNGRAQTAGPPYSKETIVEMLKSYLPPHHLADLARERGIDFQITSAVEGELARAQRCATMRRDPTLWPAPCRG
jgi:hypothetical protein